MLNVLAEDDEAVGQLNAAATRRVQERSVMTGDAAMDNMLGLTLHCYGLLVLEGEIRNGGKKLGAKELKELQDFSVAMAARAHAQHMNSLR